MKRFDFKYILLSFVILLLGVITGFLMSLKVVGTELSNCLLVVEIFLALCIFLVQLAFYIKSESSLNHHLKCLGTLGFSMSWWTLSFTFPLVILDTIPVAEKISVTALLCGVIFLNFKLAFRNFDKRWHEVGRQEFDLQTKSSRNIVDWERVTYAMNIPIELLKPGVSEVWHNITSLSMLVLLLLGWGLSDVYPVLGMTLWTAPFMVCAVCFFQASAYRFAQARKVVELERELGVLLQSVALPRRPRRSKKR
jgi:hypothetical protein